MNEKTVLPADPTYGLYRFEAIADLYYRRFHRLAPGKDEPMASYRDSSEPDNREQFREWVMSPQAFEDAIARIVALDEEVRHLKAEVYD